MKKNTVLIILLLISCILGCGKSTQIPLNCTKIDLTYPLKQIKMYDDSVGWAISLENEILFTNSGVENFFPIKTIKNISQINDFLNATFIDEQTVYVTYFSEDNAQLIVEYTNNGGNNWDQTFVTSKELVDAGSAYINFADTENGYLLYCSTPAAGIMTKLLFCTTDAGKSYSLVSDLTNEISGYPIGISFRDEENGYIAVNYHGENHYLYMTEDHAKTWESVNPFFKTDDIRYVDGHAPIFYGKDMQKGILVLKLVGESISYNLFSTNDGGNNWIPEGIIPSDTVVDYFAINEKYLYYIDDLGNLFKLSRTERSIYVS